MERFHNAQRDAVRTKLIAYLATEFSQLLNAELTKYDSASAKFTFTLPEDFQWAVMTQVAIKYSSLGWYQFDEAEEITSINVKVNMFINNNLAGEHEIIFNPKAGFENLHEVIKKIAVHIDMATLPSLTVEPKFSIARIMQEEYQEPTDDGAFFNSDYRVDEIVSKLRVMNYAKHRAIKLALFIVTKYPDVHDIDALINEILEIPEEEEKRLAIK